MLNVIGFKPLIPGLLATVVGVKGPLLKGGVLPAGNTTNPVYVTTGSVGVHLP